jgi:hypothetical protein
MDANAKPPLKLADSAGQAPPLHPDIEKEIVKPPPDTVKFRESSLFMVPFTVNGNGKQGYQVCVLAAGPEDSFKQVRDRVMGERFNGQVVESIDFLGSNKANAAPILT